MLLFLKLGSCVFVLVKVISKDFESRACWSGCEVNPVSYWDAQSIVELKETLRKCSAIKAQKYTLLSSKIIYYELNFTFE
jgi:hypothetical protein